MVTVFINFLNISTKSPGTSSLTPELSYLSTCADKSHSSFIHSVFHSDTTKIMSFWSWLTPIASEAQNIWRRNTHWARWLKEAAYHHWRASVTLGQHSWLWHGEAIFTSKREKFCGKNVSVLVFLGQTSSYLLLHCQAVAMGLAGWHDARYSVLERLGCYAINLMLWVRG